MATFQYHVLLSFSGDDRAYAEELAAALRAKGLLVFYDRYEQAKLWGRDLYQYFSKLYRTQAIYCLIVVSRSYRDKRWTRHELKSAQARAFKDRKDAYILPVKLDDTELEGIPETTGHVDGRQMSISEIADLLTEKVNEYLETFPNAIKVPKGRVGKNKEAVKGAAARVGHHVTTVVFGDQHYSQNKNPRVFDVGVDTRLVEYAYWMGDDIELCLASTVHDVQNEMMWYYLEDKYDLGMSDVFTDVQPTGHDTPASWDVRFNAEGLTEAQVVAKVREIVARHNSLMAELRKRYYSAKREQGDV